MTGELRVGSRVKVTIPEGEVDYLSDSAKYVDVAYHGGEHTAYRIPVKWVEVLPDKPNVGDTVEGAEAYDALPIGTLLDGFGFVARTRTGYISLISGHNYDHGELSQPRVIKYIPEAKQ